MQVKHQNKLWLVILSPIILIILGNITAHFFSDLLGKWAWAGYFIIYWGLILALAVGLGEKGNINHWFRKYQGSKWWLVLAIGIGLSAFPSLLFPNFKLLHSIPLLLLLCGFAFVNSIFEEIYWRGFLLDETKQLPRAFGVAYSTIFFTTIHPLNLGVFSKIQAFNPSHALALLPFIIILILLSIVYCLLYIKTKSLVLPVISHTLTDIGNLSIFLFMNMVIF